MIESERLPPNQQWTRKFPILGERQPIPGLSARTWRLELRGLVRNPTVLDYAGLLELPQRQIRCDIHCVTRWSRADTVWGGVDLADILRGAGPLADARFARFEAYSPRAHDTSLPLELCLGGEVLVAHSLDGEPLPIEHGGPVRTVVPRRYFYKSLKWLRAIELLADDRLGYWERESGYHNVADFWKEQRYIARGLSSTRLAEILESGRFPPETVLGLDLAGRSLPGFCFAGAGLKDSNLRGADLTGADFRGANLTNTDLRDCRLESAQFEGADLEGARFARANLRNANLRNTSLTATQFFEPDEGWASGATLAGADLGGAYLDGLVEVQMEFLLDSQARGQGPKF